MRPQHITAENAARPVPARGAAEGGFNEAAAYHCGKHLASVRHAVLLVDASMRPQHITAENPRRRRTPPAPTLLQ